MARETFYNQRSHSVIVAGTALEDFAEGEAINFEPQGDEITATRGLDRNALSLGSDRVGMLTVQLKPTSPSIEFLDGIIRDVKAGARGEFDVQYRDGVGQFVDAERCLCQKNNRASGGTTMQPYTYVFMMANYEERV